MKPFDFLPAGRMISGSKSGYHKQYPDNWIIFNANLVTKESGKIWHGDLDLTLDSKLLTELATSLDTEIYVLYEMDARFENEAAPKIERAAAIVSAGKIEKQVRSVL